MTVEGSAASPEPAGGGHPLTYRPQLDGLRAVAVYLVVAFHSDLGVFSGGFIGVDVFFVLSGFLVTSLLMRDLTRLGRLQWRQFYARRVRRILPAAAVTLVVTAVVYAAIATPLQVLDAVGAFRAAFLYVANWYFIHQSTDYFAADVSRNPVLHFWSLAIEEQFYLIWPLALTALYVASGWTRRWRWWVLRSVVIAAGLASAALAIHISTTNLDRAYYGTETRAYQLLAGAALAVTPQLFRLRPAWTRWAQRVAIAVFAAIAVLATSLVDRGPITRGVLVALLASALIVALEHARGGVVKRVLSAEPVTYLGRISYATYLWHWPLIVFATYNRTVAPVPLFLLDAVAATALAALSFKVLEQPIRTVRSLDRYRGPVIAMGLTLSLVLGLLVMPMILDTPSTAAAPTPRHRRGPTLLDWRDAQHDFSYGLNCLDKPVWKCTLARGRKLRVLLIGDSHANMWIPAFQQIAVKNGWRLAVAGQPGCAWQRGLYFAGPIYDCKARQADWYDRILPRLDPDLVILADKSYDDPRFTIPLVVPGGRTLKPGDSGYEQALIDASRSTIESLRDQGRKVVVIEPVPLSYPFSPVSCLSTGKPAAECSYQSDTTTTPLERYYREASEEPNVWSLNPDRLVCPRLPTCDPIVNDIIVWADEYSHMTRTYSRSLAPRVERMLRTAGVLGSR